jgi:hypothetical protein
MQPRKLPKCAVAVALRFSGGPRRRHVYRVSGQVYGASHAREGGVGVIEGIPTAAPRAWRRPLLAIAAALMILAVAAIAVVTIPLGSGTNQAADSPEAALSNFVSAVNANDYTRADSYLSLRLVKTGESTETAMQRTFGIGISNISTIKQASNAAVLTIEYTYKDDFGVHSPTQVQVDMVVEGGGWKIDTAFWNGYGA